MAAFTQQRHLRGETTSLSDLCRCRRVVTQVEGVPGRFEIEAEGVLEAAIAWRIIVDKVLADPRAIQLEDLFFDSLVEFAREIGGQRAHAEQRSH
ncbi:MAG TPA: hypothetical protein VMU99_08400 [Acidimicrobiales bacterium]|nr:hypothetical protein [Acidimicrobiales bacterium]